MTDATEGQLRLARRIADEETGPGNRGNYLWEPRFNAALRAIQETTELAAKHAETMRIGGGALSSWINTNESPMGATRRHIATAFRSFAHLKGQPHD